MKASKNKKLSRMTRNKTTKEVAAHFGVSVLTVLKWRQKGCPYTPIPIPGEKSSRVIMLHSIGEVREWRKENMLVGRPAKGIE